MLAFGLGWMARQAGDLAEAEGAYRTALQHWPGDDRVRNNLGNLLASQGRLDEALTLYRKATELQPRNAAAYFNASQVHLRRFDYRAASEASNEAAAIDFELVRNYQARTGDQLPLVDQWLSPSVFWQNLMDFPEDQIPPAAPPAWRVMVEMSGWRFSAIVLVLTAIALVAGIAWHRRLPVRGCSNCGTPVCRRCAHRRRALALCATCAAVAAAAESPEFGQILLLQQKRRVERMRSIASATFATLVPGLGLVASRRIFYAIGLLMIATLLATSSLQVPMPFPLGQEILDPQEALWTGATCWLVLYGLSIVGFMGHRPEREAARTRSAARRRKPAEKPALAA